MVNVEMIVIALILFAIQQLTLHAGKVKRFCLEKKRIFKLMILFYIKGNDGGRCYRSAECASGVCNR